TSASRSMSPEQACIPVPPVAGCRPASTRALPVCTEHVTPSPILPSALSVMTALSGCSRYLSLSGACNAFRAVASICDLHGLRLRRSYHVVATAPPGKVLVARRLRGVAGRFMVLVFPAGRQQA